MKLLRSISVMILVVIVFSGCEKEQISPETDILGELTNVDIRTYNGNISTNQKPLKITGLVEVIWKGGKKGSDMGNKPENLLAFVDIFAKEGTVDKDPKGEIVYRVLETDFSLHREIKADVFYVSVNPGQKKGWIVAEVISDSKGCSGNGGSGHDSNCSDAGHDDPCGGSSDDHSSHDGGCSHDETDEGGCSGSETEDDTHGGNGGSGTPGGEEKGNPMSGKNCRLGQFIVMKMHDGGTPGISGDGITWKWYDPEASSVNTIFTEAIWPHLCKKVIIGGNIVVHI